MSDPEVMLGKPVVAGTRIPVELVLRKLSQGASVEELLDGYPRLTREDVAAVLDYAADVIAARGGGSGRLGESIALTGPPRPNTD